MVKRKWYKWSWLEFQCTTALIFCNFIYPKELRYILYNTIRMYFHEEDIMQNKKRKKEERELTNGYKVIDL